LKKIRGGENILSNNFNFFEKNYYTARFQQWVLVYLYYQKKKK
jgi:hypothetical protein